MRNPTRKRTATASQRAGISRRTGGARRGSRRRASASMRASRYNSGGETRGTDAEKRAGVKKGHHTQKDTSTSRAQGRSGKGKREVRKGRRKNKHHRSQPDRALA